jgi:mono/diheme cytochrome c family protein
MSTLARPVAALQAVIIVASFAAAFIFLAGCRGTPSEEPPIHVIRHMYNQTRYDPQEASAFFEDGRTMRPRVAGTVAREEHVLLTVVSGRTEDDSAWLAEAPAEVLAEFGDDKAAMVERGRNRYDIYCSPCHGYTGEGNGMVAQRAQALGAATLVPPSLYDPRLRGLPDGQVFATISNGIRNLPAYRHNIRPADRWAIVRYVRALQLAGSERPALAEADADEEAAVEAAAAGGPENP